jgi:predicted O-methyltransferase YrrM
MMGKSFQHFLKVMLGIESPYTQTTQAEQKSLLKYASNVSSAVEIGVFEGVNTHKIASVLNPKGTLYGIDPFFKGKLGICWHKKIALKSIASYRSRIKLVEGFSWEVTNAIPENIDFIFIDGDHSYEGIKKDWELYTQKLRQGGIIAMHDTTAPSFDPWRANLGSVSFFNEVISKDQRFQRLETIDSLNILVKK